MAAKLVLEEEREKKENPVTSSKLSSFDYKVLIPGFLRKRALLQNQLNTKKPNII